MVLPFLLHHYRSEFEYLISVKFCPEMRMIGIDAENYNMLALYCLTVLLAIFDASWIEIENIAAQSSLSESWTS